jgi:anti-anti-sigma factor
VTSEGSEITTVCTAKDATAGVGDDVEISVFERSNHVLVRLRGEIDLATAPGLRDGLFELLRPGVGLIVLDLSEVSFCDASGLGVLVGSHRRAAKLGITLRLAALRPSIARLLHIHGLDRSLAIYPALSDALAWRGIHSRWQRS